jgi:hypothetical protein
VKPIMEVSTLLSHDPRWIAKIYQDEEGQDYLGLRLVQDYILAHLVPGVTTITPRARYYPFYCWLMAEYAGQHPTGWSFNRFLRRREQIFGLANVAYDDSVVGLTGVTAFREHWEMFGSQDVVPLTLDHSYVASGRGGYAAYAGVVRNLGLVRDHEEGEGWALLVPGQKLAAAFAQAISASTYYQNRHYYDEADSIPAAVLHDYGAHCHLNLLARSPDRDPTLETMFAFSALFVPDPRRLDSSPLGNMRGTLGIILDMVAQSDQPIDDKAFRTNSAYGACHDFARYQPAVELMPVLSQWRVFQFRELYVYALYALWTYFLEWLQSEGPAPLDSFFDDLAQTLDLTSVVHEMVLPIRYPKPFTLPLSEHLLDLLEASGVDASTWEERFETFAQQSIAPLNAQRLYERLSSFKAASSTTYLGLAWLMLTSIFFRLSGLDRDHPGWHWVEFGDARRRAMSRFIDGMNAHMHMGATVGETLQWLFRDYVVAQHTLVSLEKWQQRKANTFHFRYENGLFEWARQGSADLSSSRIRQAYDILVDLGLINTEMEPEQLSELGKAILQRMLDSYRD